MTRRTVTIHVATEGKGRQRLRRGEASKAEERPEKVPRVARLLALAHRWNDLIQEGAVKNRAELSRIVGVSRARVTQVMRLLDLAPQIQEAVLFGDVDGKGAEEALRRLSLEALWARQVTMRG